MKGKALSNFCIQATVKGRTHNNYNDNTNTTRVIQCWTGLQQSKKGSTTTYVFKIRTYDQVFQLGEERIKKQAVTNSLI